MDFESQEEEDFLNCEFNINNKDLLWLMDKLGYNPVTK